MTPFDYDVSIIGAGPSGSVAAAILCKKGHRVCVLERQKFPRFSIGESLLPQCMAYIEEAGMLEAVLKKDFQRKDGAVFGCRGEKADFNFDDKSSAGHSETFQVIRSEFDKVLIDEAENQGADLFYETSVESGTFIEEGATLSVIGPEGKRKIRSKFCLDASGYGRVLPRLLDLDVPSKFPNRVSYFTHIQDNIKSPSFNRDRILITVHPEHKDIWYWLIPFSNGTASIGVVGEDKYFVEREAEGKSPEEVLLASIEQDNDLSELLTDAVYHQPVQRIGGYSCGVKTLHGPSFALLGNAGEFLDPVFSSGVTIAIKSASLAANLLDRQFKEDDVCWEEHYTKPLMIGIDTFRSFVESWYAGDLMDIFFTEKEKDPLTQSYLSSILAGYAWDTENPYVLNPSRRLNSLTKLCR